MRRYLKSLTCKTTWKPASVNIHHNIVVNIVVNIVLNIVEVCVIVSVCHFELSGFSEFGTCSVHFNIQSELSISQLWNIVGR